MFPTLPGVQQVGGMAASEQRNGCFLVDRLRRATVTRVWRTACVNGA